jgi:hypothetical protein
MKTTAQPLESYFALYRLSLEYENKSPATLSIYMSSLGRICRSLETGFGRPATLSDLTPDAAIGYVTALKSMHCYPTKAPGDKPPGAASIDQHVRTLKGLTSLLYEKDHARSNVLKTLSRP